MTATNIDGLVATLFRGETQMECELLDKCGFFAKYNESLDLACRGFIKTYCKGAKMDECVRKQYRKDHGAPPEDDMMPSGQTMPKSFQN